MLDIRVEKVKARSSWFTLGHGLWYASEQQTDALAQAKKILNGSFNVFLFNTGTSVWIERIGKMLCHQSSEERRGVRRWRRWVYHGRTESSCTGYKTSIPLSSAFGFPVTGTVPIMIILVISLVYNYCNVQNSICKTLKQTAVVR